MARGDDAGELGRSTGTSGATALARRAREGALTTQQRDALFQACVRDARSFTVVEPTQAIAQHAATRLLTAPRPVRRRTLDAVHVASAQLAFARARRRASPPAASSQPTGR